MTVEQARSNGQLVWFVKPLLVLLALIAGLPWVASCNHTRQIATTNRLQTLQGVEDLKAAFNRDEGKIRIVLLLSPT